MPSPERDYVATAAGPSGQQYHLQEEDERREDDATTTTTPAAAAATKPTFKERWQAKTYRPLHRKWPKKARKAKWWLMAVELAGLVPILVIFGIAQPDMYRTKMWQIGYDNKLNSNPAMILYAYANHRPLPKIAFVWTRTLTDFNVAISVISLFFLLAKLIAFIMKVWFPIVAVFVNVSLVALYTVSVYGQIGPDYADPRYPAPAAWYFRYGCEMAKQRDAYQSCQIAQSSLGVTFYLLMVYVVNLGFCLYTMWPNPANDKKKDEDEDGYGPAEPKEPYNWEMQSIQTPIGRHMPYTPRTQAFHTLDRQLPLRQQQYQQQQYQQHHESQRYA